MKSKIRGFLFVWLSAIHANQGGQTQIIDRRFWNFRPDKCPLKNLDLRHPKSRMGAQILPPLSFLPPFPFLSHITTTTIHIFTFLVYSLKFFLSFFQYNLMSDRSPCFPLSRSFSTDLAVSVPPFFHPHGQNQSTFHPGSGFRSPTTIPKGKITAGMASRTNIRSLENMQRRNMQDTNEESRGKKRKPTHDSSDDSDSSDTPMKHRRSKSPEQPSRRRPRDSSPGDEDVEPTSKRNRTGLEKQFDISKLLATLDKPALLTVIHNLLDAHPNLQSEITSLLPRPTLQTVRPHLISLEKNLSMAFPYTKWGPDKSDYSFNRVRATLEELIDVVLGYASHFSQPEEFPTTTFSYLQLATSTILRLPTWNNPAHNAPKRNALVRLAEHYLTAIRNAADKISEGKIYGQSVVQEWARDLAQTNAEAGQAIFQQAMREFGDRLGWLIGMVAPPPVEQPVGLLGHAGGLFSGGQGMTQVGGGVTW